MMSTKVPTIRVSVTQKFNLPAERVFDAWLDPARLGQWMFGQEIREEEVLHLKLDARVNGRYSFLVRRNGQDIDHVGTYLELERPKRLVFTWGIKGESDQDLSRVTVDIIPNSAGCELTLVHEMDAKWAEYADRARGSWAKMVGTLAEVLDRSL